MTRTSPASFTTVPLELRTSLNGTPMTKSAVRSVNGGVVMVPRKP